MMVPQTTRKPIYQASVKAHVFPHETRLATPSFGLVEIGAPAIAEVQPEKLTPILWMTVLEQGRRHQPQRSTTRPPVITEIGILGTSPSESGIEAADVSVRGAAAEEVVARQKIRAGLAPIEVIVDEVDDQLSRRAEDIVLESIHGDSTHQRFWALPVAATSASSHSGRGMQSSSVRAMRSPRASCTPRLRAAEGG
jgi:hypothetical protein